MKKKLALLLVLLMLASLLTACGAPEPGPYEGVTVLSAEQVEELAGAVRGAYLDEDWESLSQMIRYPIRVLDTELENPEDFLAFMEDKTVHQQDREAMDQESLQELFFNSEGIRLGSGQVWLADPGYGTKGEPKLEVIALSGIIERTPGAADLQENYFRLLTEAQPGTAGSSLKLAAIACRMLSFSVSRQLRGADLEQLRANLLEAWEGLTAEERAAFDGSFIEACFLVNMSYENWELTRGTFEDAGVSDEMEYLLSYSGSWQDWSILTSNTLTMGNSDGP